MASKPDVKAFFDHDTFTVSYVIRDPDSNKAAILDSVLDFDPKSGRTSTKSADGLLAYVRDNKLDIEWILETHAHADHLTAAPYLQDKLGQGAIAIGENISKVQEVFKGVFNAEASFKTDGSQFDHLFKDGEVFKIGGLEALVMHTPGHTPACISYVIGDAVFVGDTLFMYDYGTARCDFPKGDARTLYKSIQKILALPPETRMFLCHDYMPGGREPIWETTVGEQKARNKHIHDGVSEEEFVRMRTDRDKTLDMPVLILPSVQVNMRAGHMPPPDDNDVVYLKLPVDLL